MRLLYLLLCAAAPVSVLATTVDYLDPFGTSGHSCSSSACDVVGDQRWYDLNLFSLSIDPANGTALVKVVTNFGPGSTLAPFYDTGRLLSAADIFFTVDGRIEYGLALTSHGSSITAGTLYHVTAPSGVMSAFDVLHLGAGYDYRPEFPVWLRDDGHGAIHTVGTGTVNTAVTGDGYSSGRLTVTIAFTPGHEFIDMILSGKMGAELASATCGNDIQVIPVIQFPHGLPGTPEPPGAALGGLGVAILLGYRAAKDCRKRRRQSAGSCGLARK